MSIRWETHDERQRANREQQTALKEFLKNQHEQDVMRKLKIKRQELPEYPKITQALGQDNGIAQNGGVPGTYATTNQTTYKNWNAPITDKNEPEALQTEPVYQIVPKLGLDAHVSGLNPSSDTETLSKLRIAEDAIQHEKRSRAWIESELQNSKTQMNALSARIDRLHEKSIADELKISDLTRKLTESDRVLHEMTQQLTIRNDRDTVKIQQIVNEMVAKQRAGEHARQEQDVQNRAILEQMNHMQYKIESYIMKTEQVGSDLTVKSRDWTVEAQKSNDALRAVRDHDQALQSLHSVVDSTTDTLTRRFEATQHEFRQRLEADQRARMQFETNMRELCSEWRKAIQMHERDVNDRMEAIRHALSNQIDRETDARSKLAHSVIEEQRMVEKQVLDAQASALEQITQQLNSVQAQMMDDRKANKDIESRLLASFDESLAYTQANLAKKITEVQDGSIENKHSITQVAKALQDSIMITEKSTAAKIKSIEDVLRAEIKSRMDTDSNISKIAAETKSNIESLTLKVENKMQDERDQFKAEMALVTETSKRVAEKVVESAERALVLVEADMDKLGKTVKVIESSVKDASSALKSDIQAVSELLQRQIKQTREELSVELSKSDAFEEKTHVALSDLEGKLKSVTVEMETKLGFKTAQLDSTMTAFREELHQMCSRKQLALVEARLNAISDANDLVNSDLNERLDQIEKSQENASKAELGLLKAELKLVSESIEKRSVVVDTELEILKEGQKSHSGQEHDFRSRLESLRSEQVELSNQVLQSKQLASAFAKKADVTHSVSALSKKVGDLVLRTEGLVGQVGGLMESVSDRATIAELKQLETDVTERLNLVTDTSVVIQTKILDVVQKIETAKGDVMDDVESQIERLSAGIDESKSEMQKSKQETQKRVMELQDYIMDKLRDQATAQEALISKQQQHGIQLQRELLDRSKIFNDKIAEITASLDQISDSKDDYHEDIQQQIQGLESKLANLQLGGDSRVAKSDLEKLKNQVDSLSWKLETKLESETSSLDQVYKKIADTEDAARERIKTAVNSVERSVKEQSGAVRNLRETILRRIEGIESKVQQAAITDTQNEFRTIRSEISQAQQKFTRIDSEIQNVKTILSDTISQRRCEGLVLNAVEPILNKISELSSRIERPGSRQDGNSNGSFYKPAQLTFGERRQSPKSNGPVENSEEEEKNIQII